MERAGLCRRWLLASTAIGVAGCLALSQPVSADNECGAIVGNSVTCTPAGNNYTSGITYKPTDDLTMVVQDGVTITPSSGNEGIDISFTTSGLYDLDLRLYDTDATTDITTTGSVAEGIFIRNAAYVVLLNQAEIRSSDAAIEIQSADDVIIINSGDLTAYGNAAIVVVDAGSIAITNYGNIGTDALDTDGIFILNPYGDSVIIQSMSGSIIIDQGGGHGVYIRNSSHANGNFYMHNEGGIVTYGAYSNGILVSGINGHAELIQTNTSEITTYGNNSDAIQIRDTQSGVTISADGTIRTYGDDSDAISVRDTRDTGDGTGVDYVEIIAAGDITTYGENAKGIDVHTTRGDVAVTLSDTGSITTRDNSSTGIFIDDTQGNVEISTKGSIFLRGIGAAGIHVEDTHGNVTISTLEAGSLTTHGDYAGGIYVNDTIGNVSVTAAGSIVTNGDWSSGIHTNNTSGDVAVTLSGTGGITTHGDYSDGIYARNTGDLIGVDQVGIVADGDMITYGRNAQGIDVYITRGDVVAVTLSDTGSITTQGDDSIGIFIHDTEGKVDISTLGGILTSGIGADGMFVYDTRGTVTISALGDITIYGAGATGIGVQKTTGNASVTASGAVVTGKYYSFSPATVSYAHGIYLNDTDGSATMALSDTGSITTYGAYAHGISITNTGDGSGNDYVTVSADGEITTHGNYSDGIHVYDTKGNVAISGLGDIYTYGIGSIGILVQQTTGKVDIASNNITTAQGSGLYVTDTTENVNVTATGAIVTGKYYSTSTGTSSYANGIYLNNTDDSVTITLSDTGGITTYGGRANGIYVLNSGRGVSVTAAGSIKTNGDQSAGIFVGNTSGLAKVELGDGSNIHTYASRSSGVEIEMADRASVEMSGLVATHGRYASGLLVSGIGGNVDIEVSGDITTGLSYAASTGDSRAYGIGVAAVYGDVDIDLTDAAAITTYGGRAHGIVVESTGSVGDVHDVTIDIAGSVTASGMDSNAVRVQGTYGDVVISMSGPVMGGRGEGAISLDNPGATSSAIILTQTGSLGSLDDLAIKATEPVTISNAGVLTGYLLLGDGDDSFTNSRTWYLRNLGDVARADFGGGTDQFTNTGTLSLPKGSQTLWQGEIVHLETFTNSGTIDLQDGIVGDALSISGNFISNGGSLLLDAVLDDGSSVPQADVLTLYEATLGSDATQIVIANAGGLGGATTGNGILLVDAQKPSDEGAFELAGQVISGAYEYDLYYDASAFDWYLQSAAPLFSGTAEYPALMTAALLGFGADWSALHNRIGDLRWEEEEDEKIEPAAWTSRPAAGFRPWLQFTGAQQEIDAGTPFEQRVAKLEGGVDSSFAVGNGARALLGAFAGTGRAEQDFEHSTTAAASDMAVVGLYGGYRSGRFYGDAIFKYEHQSADLNSVATDANGAPFDVDLFGGSIETGYRFIAGRSYMQPRLRVSYAHAWASSFDDGSGEAIDLQDAQSLSGEVAARLGLQLGEEIGDLHMDAGVRHEALGETEARVSGISFVDELPGTITFLSAGIAVNLIPDKLSLMLEAGYGKGDEAEEITATGALRVIY